MKILVLGDFHVGVRADDEWVQNIQRDGIKQAIDYSLKNNIDTWLQAGDWFDVRKAITHRTMEFNRELVDAITAAGIKVHVNVGNHDAAFKNTLFPNSVSELLTQFDNFTIYEHPKTVDFDGCLIDIIPWMCDDNTAEIMEHIKTSSAPYCIGHWELNGFYFYKGMKSHGLEPDFLKKYKRVWSGHFHTISEAANVKYIGTPWTLTAGDENDPRGFWVFDTETEKMEFVPNRTTWHRKITYPFKGKFNPKDYENLAVRVIVTEVDKGLTKFESELEKTVHSLRVVSKVDNSVESDDSEEIEVKTLQETMVEYINAIPDITDADREALIKYSTELYIEATQ